MIYEIKKLYILLNKIIDRKQFNNKTCLYFLNMQSLASNLKTTAFY